MTEAIKKRQSDQTVTAGQPAIDSSALTKALQAVAWTSLALVFALALKVMFWSPDMIRYEANASTFKTWAFVFTITYFVAAYAAVRRRNAVQGHT